MTAEDFEASEEILLSLLPEITLDEKIELAESLAPLDHAPRDVILALANGDIASAQIILEASPVLKEADLIKIIRDQGADYWRAIAYHPRLSLRVTSALVRTGDEYTLKFLANNHAAPISRGDYHRMVSYSKDLLVLRLPLLQRPNFPIDEALRIADWSSEAVREFIATRFDRMLDSEQYRNEVFVELASEVPDTAKPMTTQAEQSRPHPAHLNKTLHQKREDLFIKAFARLVNVAAGSLRRILSGGNIVGLALTCRAIGANRKQFNTLYALYDSFKDSHRVLRAQDHALVDNVFTAFSPAKARQAVHSLA